MSEKKTDHTEVPPQEINLCWRCRGFLLVRMITMNGGYTAHLCTWCCNDWEILARNHDLVIHIREYEAMMENARCMTCGDGEDRIDPILNLIHLLRETQNKLFYMAKEWIEGGKVKE